MKIAWVVLTMGDRTAKLEEAVSSIRVVDPRADVVVVWNGSALVASLPDIHNVVLAENVGVAEGRNIGASTTAADLVMFVDDDATIHPSFDLEALTKLFEQRQRLAVVSFLISDPLDRRSTSRHVPRLGGFGARRRGSVTAFLGGACCIRMRAFDDAGGYWGRLFFGHEETDLSWRLIAAGWTIRYEPRFQIMHPTQPGSARNGRYWHRDMFNRVLIARRNLPPFFKVVYIGIWTVISGLRAARTRHFTHVIKGLTAGMRDDQVRSEPIRLRTVTRLTKLGRPPII